MKKILILIFMLISLIPSISFCGEIEQGEVVRQNGDRFAIECTDGFVLAEWHDGYYPNVGDVYAGKFQRRGFHEFYCPTSDQMTKFLIEDFNCSEIKMLEYLYE